MLDKASSAGSKTRVVTFVDDVPALCPLGEASSHVNAVGEISGSFLVLDEWVERICDLVVLLTSLRLRKTASDVAQLDEAVTTSHIRMFFKCFRIYNEHTRHFKSRTLFRLRFAVLLITNLWSSPLAFPSSLQFALFATSCACLFPLVLGVVLRQQH